MCSGRYFKRLFFLLLPFGALGIGHSTCAMELPETQARVNELITPLQRLVDQEVGQQKVSSVSFGARERVAYMYVVEPAFQETWQLICRRACGDLHETKCTLESEQFRGEMARITGQLQENLNQWLQENRTGLFFPSQEALTVIDRTFLDKFHALEGEIALLDRQKSALLRLDERECTPEFLQHAQNAPYAILRKAYWQDIRDGLACVKEGCSWLIGLCRRPS